MNGQTLTDIIRRSNLNTLKESQTLVVSNYVLATEIM